MSQPLPIEKDADAFTCVKNSEGRWQFIHFKVSPEGQVTSVVEAPEANMRDVTTAIFKVAVQKYWNAQ